ncbi:hypothetical protein ACLOJK_035007 [Asimina triloba]
MAGIAWIDAGSLSCLTGTRNASASELELFTLLYWVPILMGHALLGRDGNLNGYWPGLLDHDLLLSSAVTHAINLKYHSFCSNMGCQGRSDRRLCVLHSSAGKVSAAFEDGLEVCHLGASAAASALVG